MMIKEGDASAEKLIEEVKEHYTREVTIPYFGLSFLLWLIVIPVIPSRGINFMPFLSSSKGTEASALICATGITLVIFFVTSLVP